MYNLENSAKNKMFFSKFAVIKVLVSHVELSHLYQKGTRKKVVPFPVIKSIKACAF
jgi:hypothetical protein